MPGNRGERDVHTKFLYTFFSCLSGTLEHKGTQKALFYCFITCWFSVKERKGKIAEADYHDARWKYLPTKMKNFVRRETFFEWIRMKFFTAVPFTDWGFVVCRSKQAPKSRFVVGESCFTKIDTYGNDFWVTPRENIGSNCSSSLSMRSPLPARSFRLFFPSKRWQQHVSRPLHRFHHKTLLHLLTVGNDFRPGEEKSCWRVERVPLGTKWKLFLISWQLFCYANLFPYPFSTSPRQTRSSDF